MAEGDQKQHRGGRPPVGSSGQSDAERKAAEEAAAAKKAEEEAQAAAASETEEETEKRYTREELFAGGHGLTGYSQVVLSGALHGDDRQSFTLDQAKDAAAKFLGRKVKS